MQDNITSAVVDAARLFGELQQEARKSVIATIQPKDNVIKFDGIAIRNFSALSTGTDKDLVLYTIPLKVNGLEVKLEGEISIGALGAYSNVQIAEQIGNAIFKTVKEELIAACKPAFRQITSSHETQL